MSEHGPAHTNPSTLTPSQASGLTPEAQALADSPELMAKHFQEAFSEAIDRGADKKAAEYTQSLTDGTYADHELHSDEAFGDLSHSAGSVQSAREHLTQLETGIHTNPIATEEDAQAFRDAQDSYRRATDKYFESASAFRTDLKDRARTSIEDNLNSTESMDAFWKLPIKIADKIDVPTSAATPEPAAPAAPTPEDEDVTPSDNPEPASVDQPAAPADHAEPLPADPANTLDAPEPQPAPDSGEPAAATPENDGDHEPTLEELGTALLQQKQDYEALPEGPERDRVHVEMLGLANTMAGRLMEGIQEEAHAAARFNRDGLEDERDVAFDRAFDLLDDYLLVRGISPSQRTEAQRVLLDLPKGTDRLEELAVDEVRLNIETTAKQAFLSGRAGETNRADDFAEEARVNHMHYAGIRGFNRETADEELAKLNFFMEHGDWPVHSGQGDPTQPVPAQPRHMQGGGETRRDNPRLKAIGQFAKRQARWGWKKTSGVRKAVANKAMAYPAAVAEIFLPPRMPKTRKGKAALMAGIAAVSLVLVDQGTDANMVGGLIDMATDNVGTADDTVKSFFS